MDSNPEIVDLTKEDDDVVDISSDESVEVNVVNLGGRRLPGSDSSERALQRRAQRLLRRLANIHNPLYDPEPIIIRPRRISPQAPPKPPSPQRPPSPPTTELKCPICIETYANIKRNGNKTVVTRCGHMFCDSCLKKSMSNSGNRKCPKCRKNIPKGVTGIIEVFDIA